MGYKIKILVNNKKYAFLDINSTFQETVDFGANVSRLSNDIFAFLISSKGNNEKQNEDDVDKFLALQKEDILKKIKNHCN